MAPTLTATRETVYEDTLERDNADVLFSRLNDIGDPTKWITVNEWEVQREKINNELLKEFGYV
jgi:hypothetical protein